MAGAVLTFAPAELVFNDVEFGQAYSKTFVITNTLKGNVEATIRPSADRITVDPQKFKLRAGETQQCTVKLKVIKFANKARAVEQGQRDVLHIKGPFFDQKLYVTFYLAHDAQDPSSKATAGALSPRGRAAAALARVSGAAQQTVTDTAAARTSSRSAVPSPERRSSLPPRAPGASGTQQLTNTTRAPAPHSFPTRGHPTGSLDQSFFLNRSFPSLASSPTLAPGSPVGSLSLATSSEDAPHPRPPPARLSYGSLGSFEFRPQPQPGTGRTPQLLSIRSAAATSYTSRGIPLQQSSATSRSAPSSPDKYTTHPPHAAHTHGTPIHSRYGAPPASTSPPQTARAHPLRHHALSMSADLGSSALLRQQVFGRDSLSGEMSFGGAASAASGAAFAAVGQGLRNLGFGSGGALDVEGESGESGGGDGGHDVEMAREFELVGLNDVRRSRQAWEELEAAEKVLERVSEQQAMHGGLGGSSAVVSGVQQHSTPAMSTNAATDTSPIHRGPSLALQSTLRSLRSTSPPSRSGSPSTWDPPADPSITTGPPLPPTTLPLNQDYSSTSTHIADPHLEATSRSTHHTTHTIQPDNPSPAAGWYTGAGAIPTPTPPLTQDSLPPSIPTRDDLSSVPSPSRREQIDASTAVIRAAFSSIAAMARTGFGVAANAPDTGVQHAGAHSPRNDHPPRPHSPPKHTLPAPLLRAQNQEDVTSRTWAESARPPSSRSARPGPPKPTQPAPSSHVNRPSTRPQGLSAAVARSPPRPTGRAMAAPPQADTRPRSRSTSPQATERPTAAAGGSPKPVWRRSGPHSPRATSPPASPVRGTSSSPVAARADGVDVGGGGRTQLEVSLDAYKVHVGVQRGELQARLRAVESQLSSLQLTASAQLQALADREDTIQILQAQLSTSKRAQALEAAQAPPPVFETEARELRLRNRQLEGQIKDLEAQVNRHRDESTALKRLNTELQSRAPDAKRLVDAAVNRQNIMQEERNRKALALLLSKDERIKELEEKVDDLEREIHSVRNTCASALSQLETTQAHVLQVLRDKDKMRNDMEGERQAQQQQMMELHAELAALTSAASGREAAEQQAVDAQDSLTQLTSQLRCQSGELALARQESARLLQELAQAQARIQFLESSVAQSRSDHAQHVKRVTSLCQDHVDELTARSQDMERTMTDQANKLGQVYSAGLGTRLPSLGLQAGASARDLLQPSMEQELLNARTLINQLQAELDSLRAQHPNLPQSTTTTNVGAASAAALSGHSWSGLAGIDFAGAGVGPGGAGVAHEERMITMEFELSRLWDLMVSRDAEILRLRSELALAGVGGPGRAGSGGPGGDVDAARVDRERALAVQLAEAQLALQLAQEKLVMVEARASIAQEKNPSSDALHRELEAARIEVRRSRTDLELSHATSARLNARITDLAAAEARARQEADMLRGALDKAHELHAREVGALEERLLVKATSQQQQGKAFANQPQPAGRTGGVATALAGLRNLDRPVAATGARLPAAVAAAGMPEQSGATGLGGDRDVDGGGVQREKGPSAREMKLQEALDTALARVTSQESLIAEAQELAARKAMQVHGTMSAELAALTRRVSHSELELSRVRAELERKSEALAATDAQIQATQAVLYSEQTVAGKAREDAAAECERLREELDMKQRDLDHAQHQSEQRLAQVSVLMETIEALQAGSEGDQQQRMLMLTAQLAASRSHEALLEQRCEELAKECDAAHRALGQAQREAQAAHATALQTQQQLAAATGLVQSREQQLEAARQDAQTQADECVRVARDLDGSIARCAALEAEAEGMRVTLRDIQARHVEQITREREEAAENTRFIRNEAAFAGSKRVPQADRAFVQRVGEPLQDLLVFVQRKAADGGEDVNKQIMTHVMQELQTILPHLDQLYHQAATDAMLAKGAAAAAQARAAAQSSALESRTAEWQVAQVTCQRLQRLTSRRAEQASAHSTRMARELRQRVASLTQQVDAAVQAEASATAQLVVLRGALAAQQAAAAAATAQLALAKADVRHLSARLAAANLEQMAVQQQQQASSSFDAPLYLDQLIARLNVKDQDGRQKLAAMIKELAAVKQAEGITQAQLRSAHQAADAAALSNYSLRESAQQAVAQLTALQQRFAGDVHPTLPIPGGSDALAGTAGLIPITSLSAPGGSGVAAGLAWVDALAQSHEVAKLRVQLVVQGKEVARLKDQLLETQQVLEASETEVSELQAGAAAHQLLLQQHQDEAATALLRQRQQLDQAHEADRQLLLREISDMQARIETIRDMAAQEAQDAESRLSLTRETMADELDLAVQRALEGQAPAEQLWEAQGRADEAERGVERLEKQVEVLQAQLSKERAKVLELEDVKEVTAATVDGLERTLASIEAAAHASNTPVGALADRTNRTARSAGKQRPGVGTSMDRPGGGGKGHGGDKGGVTLEALSRELVRAKLSEADAVRRLRACARAEVELQQRVLQRDARISELKEMIGAQTGGDGAGPGGRARARSVSPRPARTRVAGGAGAEAEGRGAGRAPGMEVARGVEEGGVASLRMECERLNRSLTQARLQVTRKDAEIQKLQGDLASLLASRPPNTTHPPLSQARHTPSLSTTRPSPTPAAVGDRIYTELSLANTTLTTSLAMVRGMLRQLGVLPTPARHSYRVDVGSDTDVPRALSAALQQLTAALRERTGNTTGSAQQYLSSPTLTPHHQTLDKTERTLDVRMMALRLEQAEARCQKLQQQVRDLTHATAERAVPHGEGVQGDAPRVQGVQGAREPLLITSLLSRRSSDRSQELGGLVKGLNRDERRPPLIRTGSAGVEGSGTSHEAGASVGVAAGGNAGSARASGGSSGLAQAQRLLSLLRQSSSALQVVCQELADVCLRPQHQPDHVHQASAAVLSEVLAMEASVDLLATELNRLVRGSHDEVVEPSGGAVQGHLPRSDNQPLLGTASQAAGQTFAFPAAASSPAVAPSPAPSNTSWVTVQPGELTPAPVDRTSERDHDREGEGPPSPPGSSSSSEPSLSDVIARNRMRDITTSVPVLDPTPATSDLLAERVLQQKARADKWRERARDLGRQLALLGAGSAARDAAVNERVMAAERAADEQVVRHKAEVNRLQAALAGAEAARKELEKSLASYKTLGPGLPGGAGVQPQTNYTSIEGIAGTGAMGTAAVGHATTGALVAELKARCATLERTLDTQQAQYQTTHAALSDETSRLRASLAQEQGERARLLAGMRDALAGLRTTGDVEGRLRSELLQAHQAAAAAKSALERVEAQADVRANEVQALKERLKASEKARSDMIQRMQFQLNSALIRCDRLTETMVAKVDELSMKLAATAATLIAPTEATEVKLRHLEADLQAMTDKLATVCLEHQQDLAGEQLSRVASTHEQQRVIEALQEELETNKAAASRQLAEMQVLLSDTVRRLEAAGEDQRAIQHRAAQGAVSADAERQRLTEQHLAQITDLESRMERERHALYQEVEERCEAVAAAREQAASAAGAAALAACEAEYSDRLRACENDRDAFRAQLMQVQAAFRAFQKQKAAEIEGLEERVVAAIGAGQDVGRGGDGGGGGGGSPVHPVQQRGVGMRVPANYRGATGASTRGRVVIKTRANGRGRAGAGEGAGWGNAGGGGDEAYGAPVDEVVGIAGQDAAAAARRDLLFEQLQRQRAEAQLGASRRAAQTLRARLRLAQRQLATLRATSVTGEEHARVLGEAERLREALRACRLESSRRQKALQLLQSVAVGAAAGGGGGGRARQQQQPDMEAAQMAAAAAAVVAAEQAALATAALEDATGERGEGMLGGGSDVWGGGGGGDDPFKHVASMASMAAGQANAALTQEREVRRLLEGRLRDMQVNAARRQQLIKDLRVKVTGLEQQLVVAQAAAAAATSDAQLEAKLKQATSALVRKDVLLQEVKAQLEAAQAKESESADSSAKEQAARDGRVITRLRSELARKEVALQAAQTELQSEKARCEACVSEMSTVRASLTTSHTQRDTALLKTRDLMNAIKDLLRLLFRCSTAASAAAEAGSGPGDGKGGGGGDHGGGRPAGAGRAGNAGQVVGLSLDDIASLTSLSVVEVCDLLGSDGGGGLSGGRAGRRSVAVAAARSRCESLLEVLEATLLPRTPDVGGDTGAGGGGQLGVVVRVKGLEVEEAWDPKDLRLLVSFAEQEVVAVERAVGVAA